MNIGSSPHGPLLHMGSAPHCLVPLVGNTPHPKPLHRRALAMRGTHHTERSPSQCIPMRALPATRSGHRTHSPFVHCMNNWRISGEKLRSLHLGSNEKGRCKGKRMATDRESSLSAAVLRTSLTKMMTLAARSQSYAGWPHGVQCWRQHKQGHVITPHHRMRPSSSPSPSRGVQNENDFRAWRDVT
jgi:hypothetical protein